jgi:hypothetical protein
MKTEIKYKNIIISGLLAGFVILIIGGCLFPILGNQMDMILANRNVPPMGTGSMIYFAIISLVLGLAIITSYSIVEKQTKSKQKAKIIISLIFWFFTYFWSNSALVAYGFMPISFVAIGTLWGLLEIYIAIILGAKIYDKLNSEKKLRTANTQYT